MLNMVGTHIIILGMCNRIVPIHLQVLVLYNKYNILLLSHSKEIQLVFFSTNYIHSNNELKCNFKCDNILH